MLTKVKRRTYKAFCMYIFVLTTVYECEYRLKNRLCELGWVVDEGLFNCLFTVK